MTQQYPPHGQQPGGQQPYGPQPGGQQPYGQPSYGHQPDPWQAPQAPWSGWSPEQQPAFPPPPKSKTPMIMGVIAAVVVIGLVTLVIVLNQGSAPSSAGPGGDSATVAPTSTSYPPATWKSSTTTVSTPSSEPEPELTTDASDPDLADIGDCIKVNNASATDADIERIACSSPDAVYKVGEKLFSASADCPSDSYDKYTHTGTYAIEYALCLMLNAEKGDCFSNITSSDGATAKVSCSASDAEGKVTKVVNGKAAESACPADTGLALVYPKPGETVCLVKVS